MKKLNKSAFSLLEVLLASIIFIVSVGGVFLTLNAIRRPVANKESALTAAIFGKQVLEALRSGVNAGSYYSACVTVNPVDGSCGDFTLSLGTHEVASSVLTPLGLTWPSAAISTVNTGHCTVGPPCLNYTVTCADGSSPSYGSTAACSNPDSARKVDLNITWPDAP